MRTPKIELLSKVGIKIALRNMKDSQNVGHVNKVTRGSVMDEGTRNMENMKNTKTKGAIK